MGMAANQVPAHVEPDVFRRVTQGARGRQLRWALPRVDTPCRLGAEYGGPSIGGPATRMPCDGRMADAGSARTTDRGRTGSGVRRGGSGTTMRTSGWALEPRPIAGADNAVPRDSFRGDGSGNSSTSTSESSAAPAARRRAFTKPHTGRRRKSETQPEPWSRLLRALVYTDTGADKFSDPN